VIPADFHIAQLAATLYPLYKQELSEQSAKEGYTHYLRAQLRHRAVTEAFELEKEVKRQRAEQLLEMQEAQK
jgi:hypothetical protein